MDLVVVAIVVLLLPLCLARPFAGAVLYTTLAYLRPQNLVGGLAFSLRLSMIVLAATVVGLAIAVVRGKEKPLLRTPWFALLSVLLGVTWVATQYAVFPELATPAWLDFLKLLTGVAITVALCTTGERVRTIATTAAMCLGTMAVISLVRPVWDAGRLTGAGGQFRDSNDFALALCMALPMLVYFRRSEEKRWRKVLLTIPIPFVLAAIVLTYSRGGFLTLAAVGIAWVLTSRGRFLRLALAPIAALLFLSLAPQKYIDRVGTIRSYAHDSSARDRISSWQVATRIAEERPWTGVGPGNFLEVYPRYQRDFRSPHVAHNTYLQFLADAGLGAALTFAVLLAWGVVTSLKLAMRIRARRARLAATGADPAKRRGLRWIDDHASGIAVALLAFAVGSQFLSRNDFDLFYLLTGLAGAMAVIGRRELKATAPATAKPVVRGRVVQERACISAA